MAVPEMTAETAASAPPAPTEAILGPSGPEKDAAHAQAVNVAIAKALGWTNIRKEHLTFTKGGKLHAVPMGDVEIYMEVPDDPECSGQVTVPRAIPNFHGSLDQCAIFEATLTEEQRAKYGEELYRFPDVGLHNESGDAIDMSYRMGASFAMAKAPQRCAAFLRVKGGEA